MIAFIEGGLHDLGVFFSVHEIAFSVLDQFEDRRKQIGSLRPSILRMTWRFEILNLAAPFCIIVLFFVFHNFLWL